MTDCAAEQPAMWSHADRSLTLGRLLLAAVMIGSVAFCGMELAQRAGQIPTIWPANGLLLAILLTSRPDRWRAYALTGFLAIVGGIILSSFPVETCIRLALVNCCEVMIALTLVRRFIGHDCDLSRPRNLWRFALVATMVAPACATGLNVALKSLLSVEGPSAPLFIASFFAHALGIVTVTPFSLAVLRRDLSGLLDPQRARTTFVVFALLIGTTTLVFVQSRYPLLFLVLPPLVAVVLFYGLAGGALGLFLATLVAVGFTFAGSGPTTIIIGASALERGLVVQLFAGVAAGLVLVLSAVLAERDRALRQLRAARDDLSRLATTDGLTGLVNRRRLDETLDTECRRAARDQTSLSFLLLDVDRFKAFNDHYGHQAGDRCLETIASTLKALCRRSGDLVARYGGEELAILLPATSHAGAFKVAETVRAAIEALAIPHEGNGACGGVVTVSIGCGTASPHSLAYEAETLIGAADEFLYEAKRTGRNRAMSATLRPVDPVPPVLANEEQRLAAVHTYHSAVEGRRSVDLDGVARLAAKLLGAPIGLVSMVGRDQQVFVGRYGVDVAKTGRDVSFCSHTITGDSPLVVADATADPRFENNPLVTGDLGLRFYAGAPLVSAEGGHRLGALCVIDSVRREPLTSDQRAQLTKLAGVAMEALEDARSSRAVALTPS